jgi:leader peptidase (prepilin peptidase)/N-methyltransferase
MVPEFPAVPFAFAFGLCIGSFLNVCVYRMPKGGSLVRPGSRCPHCRKPIKPYDNIPVLSWLILGGRCRNCRKPISARYPLVELSMGVLTAALCWRWEGRWIWLATAVAAAGMLLTLSLIDFDTFYIPDVLSLGLVALGLAAAPFNPWFEGSLLERWGASVFGAAAGLGSMWLLAWAGEKIFKKEALGGGDIKLMAGVGALFGWQGAFSTVMIGSCAGTVYGLTMMALGRVGRRDAIPFGPFLSMGAAVNLFARLGPLDFLIRF